MSYAKEYHKAYSHRQLLNANGEYLRHFSSSNGSFVPRDDQAGYAGNTSQPSPLLHREAKNKVHFK